MPELPEVERFKQYFEGTALHQKVTQVEINDAKVLSCDPTDLKEAIEKQTFDKTERIGKYLFVTTSAQKVVMFHFGMTGSFKYYRDDPPRFGRVVFHLDNGFHLAFDCPRKFGRLDVGNSVKAFQTKKRLSTDAYKMEWEEFEKNLSGRTGMIKPLLLNQQITAGVGNWIADEILHQAEIHPETRANHLGKDDYQRIFQKMKDILHTAVSHEANYNEYPEDYFIHRRGWTELDLKECARCSTEVTHMKVGGRATYICEDCQKKS
ncbi:MAG TPA: DNA-formamidopyrimidine glycosylase [Microscillaceae bacterium]|nr:DNA-formamidopyrimidine glycosylase [Microscillaceae bacterium]